MIDKTILIAIEGKTAEQDFLISGFLTSLKKEFKKVVVLFQKEKVEHYSELYSGENVIFDGIKEKKNSFLQEKFFNLLRYSIYARTAKLRLMRTVFKQSGFQFNSWIFFIFPCLISWHLSKFKFWREFLRWIYSLGKPDEFCLEILKKHKADLVFCDFTPVSVKDFNLKLLKASKKLGIKTCGNIVSWDQLTSKTFITQKTDWLICHNENIRQEAMQFGDFKKEAIQITGAPRFDFYLNPDIYFSRQEFFQQISADPGKKMIVFAGGLREFELDYDYFFSVFEKMAKQELQKVQFYLRPYPELPFTQSLKDKYKNSPYLVFEKEHKNREQVLANLFKHSQALICVYSTLMIEACLADLPIINLSYFPGAEYKLYYEPRRQLEKNHLKNIFSKNPCKMAESDEQLLKFIKEYLENSQIDKEARKKTAQEQLSFLDGRSAERVFQFIKEISS